MGSQPRGHSSSQGSGAWVPSAHSGLAGLLQVGLPVSGPLPPWLPQRSLLTQIFLEALHVKKLPTELGWRFLGTPLGCVEQQSAVRSSRGGGKIYREEGRKGKEKGQLVGGGGGSGLACSQGPAPAGKVNGPAQ